MYKVDSRPDDNVNLPRRADRSARRCWRAWSDEVMAQEHRAQG